MNIKNGEFKVEEGIVIEGKYIFPENNNRAGEIVIIIPGLLADSNHHLFYNAAHYFTQHEYATLRLDLFGPKSNQSKFGQRKFSETSRYISQVFQQLSNEFDKLTVIAHSMAAIWVLWSDINYLQKIILWDPSQHPRNIFSSVEKIDNGLHFVYTTDFKALLSREFINSLEKIPSLEKLIQNTPVPTYVISAELGGQKVAETHYGPYVEEHITIPNANHSFGLLEHEKELFSQTITLMV